MKRLAVAVVALVCLLLSGVALGSVVANSTRPTPDSSPGRPSGRAGSSGAVTAVHGGPIDRFHGSGCTLTNVSTLLGNWTHGDYVSAVAMASGDSTMIMQAAQSDCGKPMVALNHSGPPANALAAIQQHASSHAQTAIMEHASGHAATAAGGHTPGS
jgi:hypothetical protein